MPTIRIDSSSFIRGIKSDRIGIGNSVLAPSGFYAYSNGVDLHAVSYEGQPTTAQIFGAGSIVITNVGSASIARAVAVDVNTATPNMHYILGGYANAAPKLLRVSDDVIAGSLEITAHSGANFTTLPAANSYWGEDIIPYKTAGSAFIFYSWNDSASGDVGRMTYIAGSQDDDFMSTVPAGSATLVRAVPHKMVEGATGILYITNGRYVAQYDGATGASGTFDNDRYDLGPGWIAQDVRAYGNLLAIAAIRSGETFRNYTARGICRVNLWNMTESGLGLVYEIEDNYLSATYVANNRLFAWTIGRNNTQKLWEFNGNRFVLLWENATFTTLPEPDQIEVYKNLLCWITSGGNVLALDLDTNGVHVPYIINDGATDVTTAGVLVNTDQSELWAGGSFGSDYKLANLTFASTNYATGNRDLRTRVYPLSFKATILGFRFYFSRLAASASIRFSLFRNFVSINVGGSTDQLNLTLDNATYGAITEYEYNITIPDTNAFWMNFRFVGQATLRAVEIDWEPKK